MQPEVADVFVVLDLVRVDDHLDVSLDGHAVGVEIHVGVLRVDGLGTGREHLEALAEHAHVEGGVGHARDVVHAYAPEEQLRRFWNDPSVRSNDRLPVADEPLLRRNGHALRVVRALLSEERQRVLCIETRVLAEQQAADGHSCPAFARLAVHRRHVFRTARQPLDRVQHERLDR